MILQRFDEMQAQNPHKPDSPYIWSLIIWLLEDLGFTISCSVDHFSVEWYANTL